MNSGSIAFKNKHVVMVICFASKIFSLYRFYQYGYHGFIVSTTQSVHGWGICKHSEGIDDNNYNCCCDLDLKAKYQKYRTQGKFKIGKSLIKWQKLKPKHIIRIENSCHIPDLVQVFPYVENSGLNLVL